MKDGRRPVAGALACFAAAALVALFADDIRRWPETIRKGDVQMRVAPQKGDPWKSPDRLPFGLARRVVSVDDDLVFRRALRFYLLSRPRFRARFSVTFIPPIDGARRRMRAIMDSDAERRDRSAAANFLGVMVLDVRGFSDVSYLRQGIRFFRDAVRLDPTDEEAKFNLELQLARSPEPPKRSRERGTRGRQTSNTEGAGSVLRGRGY